MSKPCSPHLIILKSPARGCNEAIHSRLINDGILLVAFALDGPEIAFMRQGNQVNPGITSTKIQFTRKLIPEPDGLEQEGIFGVSFQIRLHQSLETIAFVAFGEGDFAVFSEDRIKRDHKCLLSDLILNERK